MQLNLDELTQLAEISKKLSNGYHISEQDFAWAKNRFYEMMEWDAETGEPTEACIQSLGLDMLLQRKL